MATRETELPGVGTKHTLDLATGDELVVVEHRSGNWELARSDEEGNTSSILTLQGKEAGELGRILAHGEVPEEDPRKQLLLDEFSLEWVKLDGDSALVGKTLISSDVRARTGVSVIALLREGGSLLNPPPETSFEADDTAVIIGRRDQVDRFLETFSPPRDTP
ncbi:MAG: cation:proton antiporter regulatory subunit [bacterium]|nr:cation:proton antiporter regulatory subunit [bacterium]